MPMHKQALSMCGLGPQAKESHGHVFLLEIIADLADYGHVVALQAWKDLIGQHLSLTVME